MGGWEYALIRKKGCQIKLSSKASRDECGLASMTTCLNYAPGLSGCVKPRRILQ